MARPRVSSAMPNWARLGEQVADSSEDVGMHLAGGGTLVQGVGIPQHEGQDVANSGITVCGQARRKIPDRRCYPGGSHLPVWLTGLARERPPYRARTAEP